MAPNSENPKTAWDRLNGDIHDVPVHSYLDFIAGAIPNLAAQIRTAVACVVLVGTAVPSDNKISSLVTATKHVPGANEVVSEIFDGPELDGTCSIESQPKIQLPEPTSEETFLPEGQKEYVKNGLYLVGIAALFTVLHALLSATRHRNLATALSKREELIQLLERNIKELEAQLAGIAALHEQALSELEEKSRKHLREQEEKWDRAKSAANQAKRGAEAEMIRLAGELRNANSELREAKRINAALVEGAMDGTVVLAAKALGHSISALMADFDEKLKRAGADTKDGRIFLVSVSPDITPLLEEIKIQLAKVAHEWCGDQNPNKEMNEGLIGPLVDDLERARAALRDGSFKDAYEVAQRLKGVLAFLERLSQIHATQETSADNSWSEYLKSNAIPDNWLTRDGKLIDFFAILELDPIDHWTVEFCAEVIKKYRKKVFNFHPDRGGEAAEMAQLNEAKSVLENQDLTLLYVVAYKAFHSSRPHEKAATA